MSGKASNAANGNRAGATSTEGQMAFNVGDLVVNFGSTAKVLAVDVERGLLLRALPGQGFGRGRDRWHADPAKCVRVHVAEFDRWMTDRDDPEFIADPAKRWCRVCTGALDDPRHIPWRA